MQISLSLQEMMNTVKKEQGRGGSTLKFGGEEAGRFPLTRYRSWGEGKGLQIKGTGFRKCLRRGEAGGLENSKCIELGKDAPQHTHTYT